MYKCQYCESEKIKGRVQLNLTKHISSKLCVSEIAKTGIFMSYTTAPVLCDVCEECGHILRFYFDKPSPDFKVDGVEYNK